MESFRLGLAAFTAFALFCLPVAADDGGEAAKMENAEVLKKLADYDSIFMSGFTVSGTQQGNESVVLRGPPLKGVKRKWRLTFSGDRIAYRTEMISYPKPKYEDLEGADTEIDEKKTRSISIKTKQWGYWGNDVSGTHYENTVLTLDPTGEVVEKKEKLIDSMLFGPRAAGPIAPKRILLWSLGRFYSKQLDKVTRVEKSPGGRLMVSARGEQSPGYKGRWDLEIEPAAAWMVRTARFYWDDAPDRMRAEIKNEGTVWSGPHCIPKVADCNYWGPLSDGNGPEHITFEPLVEPFDDKLYAEARQAVVDNKTPELTVMDYRVTPITISEPNKPAPTHTSTRPPEPVSSGKVWFVIVNVVIGLSILVLYLLRKRQGDNTPGSPAE